MDFEKLHSYATTYSSPESPYLQELSRRTHLEVLKPRMLSGALQGNVLQMMIRMAQPKTVLEIGTFTGYAALVMAAALPEGGHLHTIERNEELRGRVTRTFAESGLQNRITSHWGKAKDVIDSLDLTFDFVFLDADKENYLSYYRQIYPKLKPKGWLVADNVLWSGKVLESTKNNDKKTKALVEFTETLHQEEKAGNFHVLLPIRDGLLVLQKN